MAMEVIEVVRMTKPVVTRILKSSKNETNPGGAVDITGYTIKLIVKNRLSSDDARKLFDLAASIVTAASGIYKFTFTSAHTCLPRGTYAAELRWWAGTASGPPDDAIDVDFVVLDAVEKYS